MPLTRIEIEQIGPGKWVAEVEGGGGSSAVRRNVVGSSFEEIILGVVEAHAAVVPQPKPTAAEVPSNEHARPVPRWRPPLEGEIERVTRTNTLPLTASERAAAESAALQGEVDELPALNELRDHAQALGIDVDLRWREKRLMDEIETAKAQQGSGDAA